MKQINKQITVLHLVKTSIGASWALRLMQRLKREGIDVHVALPLGGPLIAAYLDAGIKIHELDYSIKGFLKSCIKLRQIVKEVHPNIVHSHFVITTMVMRIALRDFKIPRIFEVPGPLHLENTFFRNIELLLRQKNDYWIPTCQWSFDRYLRSNISRDKLYLSYYGNDISHKQYQSGKLKEELGLSHSDIIIGMVAYMYAPKKFLGQKRGLKGHEDFIDAMKIVCDKYPNVYGVCIGGAWNGAVEYEKQVKEYGNRVCPKIHFLGTRKNIGELYQDIAIAVHPSHSENLGGAAESLALGIPTIASNIGGFPDIVRDEETGLLVPVKDSLALALAIERMITNLEYAKSLALSGQKLVVNLMDIERTSNEMLEIYKDILKTK